MKIIISTIPIRPKPTSFPPVGSTTLIDTLMKAGYTPKLYDIDGLRPNFEEVVDYFQREQPDILGISAVVSTAYGYVKKLTHAVKQASPKTKIVLGGCLAASGEILLRKCPIDICVVGEGEKVLMNLVKYYEQFHDFDPSRKEFKIIKGLAYIDSDKNFIFSGHEEQLRPEELPQPNYDLLAKFSNINNYIFDPLTPDLFGNDSRSYEKHRQGQKCCFVMTGKGCSNRCTFCHRWIKGYRNYPIENIVKTIKELKKKYNVGFFIIGDESFGANPSMIDEFIEAVKPLDILFFIQGIRVSVVCYYPEVIHKLKEAGCVQMCFGLETGSDKILTIMEKGINSEKNLKVAKLLLKEGMYTIHQFVIGMPGENDKTIKETIECIKLATQDMDSLPRISVNFFQALPGTPGYEFIREQGLVGNSLDDEEAYLLNISDINAASRFHYKNVSEECLSKVYLWSTRIRVDTMINWYQRHNWKSSNKSTNPVQSNKKGQSKLSFIHRLTTTKLYYRMVSLLGESYWTIMTFFVRLYLYGIKKTLLFTFTNKQEEDRSPFIIKRPKSLRQIITYPDPEKLSVSEANMLSLRIGR